jgi:hypothetical protein
MGRADYLELGDWNAICSMCGGKRKASQMVKNWQGLYRCPEHNEPRHPQDFVRAVPDVQTPPWTQPLPESYGVFQQPTLFINESSGFQTVRVNVGQGGGATLVISVGEGINLGLLVLEESTDTDAIPADSIVINNSGELGTIVNQDEIPTTVNTWTGGGFALPPKLAFTVQPSDVGADEVISPAVKVELQYSNGDVVTGFNVVLELSIGNNPGGAVLSGTLQVQTVDGVATFSDLSLDEAGDGYTLVASFPTATNVDTVESTAFDVTAFELIINGNTSNYNVYDAFVTKYGTPPADVTLTVIVEPGVVVDSPASEQVRPALRLGSSWIGTPNISLINEGYILGRGGSGGQGGGASIGVVSPGVVGSSGGNAIALDGYDLTIDNASGNIWGGGGGGGGGGSAAGDADIAGFPAAIVGNGGGRGAGIVGAGAPTGSQNFSGVWTVISQPVAGQGQSAPLISQVSVLGGALGEYTHLGASLFSGNGGDGGGYGDAGTLGSSGDWTTGGGDNFMASTGGAGGAAGKAISLSGGNANFLSGGSSPNVKGAVS